MGLNNQNIIGADELIAKIKAAHQYIEKSVPKLIGGLAVEYFKASFENEGFTDTTTIKWASRKSKTRLNKKILIGQGSGDHLADSIAYKITGNTIVIYTDKPYAQIHNDGGKITVTPKMRGFFGQKTNKPRMEEI